MQPRGGGWLRLSPFLLMTLAGSLGATEPAPTRWVQDSFEDFSAGRLTEGGANLYVTRALPAIPRAIFVSDNGDRYPVLDRVEVELR